MSCLDEETILAFCSGALAPGKRADFLVLSADPLQCPPEAIKDIGVQQTWVNGGPVMVQP